MATIRRREEEAGVSSALLFVLGIAIALAASVFFYSQGYINSDSNYDRIAPAAGEQIDTTAPAQQTPMNENEARPIQRY